MRFEDIKIGGIYKKYSNNFVFIVKDIVKKDDKIYLKWSARNRKGLEGRTFCDNISKIDFYDIFEEKDFEKYEN